MIEGFPQSLNRGDSIGSETDGSIWVGSYGGGSFYFRTAYTVAISVWGLR